MVETKAIRMILVMIIVTTTRTSSLTAGTIEIVTILILALVAERLLTCPLCTEEKTIRETKEVVEVLQLPNQSLLL
jgi:hypothetical protein